MFGFKISSIWLPFFFCCSLSIREAIYRVNFLLTSNSTVLFWPFALNIIISVGMLLLTSLRGMYDGYDSICELGKDIYMDMWVRG